MSSRPLFVVTHPRSCSTAFERVSTHLYFPVVFICSQECAQVFLTRNDDIACAHEPFGDAFYYGPERLGHRFTDDAESRGRSGFSHVTYKDVLARFEADSNGDKV